MATTRVALWASASVNWRLRCLGTSTPTSVSASRVRTLIGWCSTTWVPALVTVMPGACAAIAPAMTERAALPVHSITTTGADAAPASGGDSVLTGTADSDGTATHDAGRATARQVRIPTMHSCAHSG